MKSLILFAHGSRRQESNTEVAILAGKVLQQPDNPYEVVTCAFLELAEPNLNDTISGIIKEGIDNITVLPYFLNSGNHVQQDIPALIAQARADYPQCNFKLANPIGMYEGMPELILHSVQNL